MSEVRAAARRPQFARGRIASREVFSWRARSRSLLVPYVETARDTAAARDAKEVGPALSVARLHAGLAIDAVVEDDDRQIGRPLSPYGRESAEAHQHFSVAGYYRDAALG